MWWLISIGCFAAYAFLWAHARDKKNRSILEAIAADEARANAKADALDNVRTVIDAAIAALERRK
jgi:hypothetical protein